MEVAIRWSPHASPERRQFLIVDVAGNRVRLCEAETTDSNPIKYKHLCLRDKLPNYTAFDWSKTQPYVVGIGAASGEANLVQIDPTRSIQEDYIWSFPIKHQRKCNSIAFSDNNLLATGLDRVRNDFCMNVYDLSVASPGPTQQEPYKKLAVSEAISSIKFFGQQPNLLVAGVFRQCVRLYDLRDSSTNGSMHLPTRQVHNLAIDPMDENYFISAGPSGEPVVSVWDLRFSPKPSTTTLEGTPVGAVLDIKPAVDNSQSAAIWNLRFSGTKRGLFGVLSSTGEIKIVELAEHSVKGLPVVSPSNPHGGTPWTFKHYTRQTHNLAYPWYDENHGQDETCRVVACDFLSGNCIEKGASLLALHPNREINRLDVPHRPSRVNLTAMDELFVWNDTQRFFKPEYKYATAAEELLAFRRTIEDSSASRRPSAEKAMNDTATRLDELSLEHHGQRSSVESGIGDSSESLHEEALSLSFPDFVPSMTEALTLLRTQRRRCMEGYRLDPDKNQQIVADDPWLVDMWEYIKRFDDLARNNGMRSGGLDLSYLGIYSIWNNSFGKHRNRTFNNGAYETDQFIDAVVSITQSKGYPAFQGHKTRRPAHRQLCLAICGWAFSKERLRSYCKHLMEQGKHYKAIVIAVMRGFRDLAQDLLKLAIQQRALQNIGLAAVIACETVNQEQRDLCQWMMDATDEPYLKALLAYFVTGDWHVVVDMDGLALSDRVGVALKYLDDARLDDFIKMRTAQAVIFGNIEGLVLTGLTDKTMDLFWHYIAKFNDLQTAVLAMSFSCPLYLTDQRYDAWKETYLMQMQVWKCFDERFRFLTEHAQHCINQDSKRFVDSTSAIAGGNGIQPRLRCNHCHNPLSLRVLKSSPFPPSTSNGTIVEAGGARANGGQIITITAPNHLSFSRTPAARDGAICPQCGRRMPACGVCGLLLGGPDPKKSGVQNTDDNLAKQSLMCFSCGHGFHGNHAREWFGKHRECAVTGCGCVCGLLR